MPELYSRLELSQTGLIPPIVSDYLAGDPFLASQIAYPNQPDFFGKAMEQRDFPAENRLILSKHLTDQYRNAGITLDAFPEVFKNIVALENHATFTITTGHQLSLFGGPMFMAFKILTAIKEAELLNRAYPGKYFVPVLWLASEDHDFEEIKGTQLFGKHINWELDSNNKPTGKLPTTGLEAVLNELISMFPGDGRFEKAISRLKSAYLNHPTLAKATLNYYHSLFAEFGLVILDPDAAELKKLFRDVMKNDLLQGKHLKAQQETDEVLKQRYKLQINAREVNFFFLHQQAGRKMLRKTDSGFQLAETDIEFSTSELEDAIESSPELFSPNVNLRPVYQETILPNLAYVGGPAEIAYWLQLKPLFELNGRKFPALVLRFMAAVAGKSLIEKAKKMGIGFDQLIGTEAQVSELYMDQVKPFDIQGSSDEILDKLQVFVDATKNTDPELSKVFLQKKLEMKDFLRNQGAQLKRSLQKAEEQQLDKILKIRQKLYPGGVFQERTDTFLSLEISQNPLTASSLLDLINPFEPALNLLLN